MRTMERRETYSSQNTTKKRIYHIAKRALDVMASALGLIVLSLPLVLIALLIKLESPGPAIFVHNRIGKNGKTLLLLKFRSMHANAEDMLDSLSPEQKAEWERNFKLENDPRITRLGKLLRKSSLDELPQLINILRGELSIVGSRPVVTEELERYGEKREVSKRYARFDGILASLCPQHLQL